METQVSYAVNDRPNNRPLVIHIGTELTITVEDWDGIEFTCGGDSGPVVRVTGGTLAVLRCSI